MRKWNFCAGPAVISEEVLEEVKSELLEYNNSGTSIMEVSHKISTYLNGFNLLKSKELGNFLLILYITMATEKATILIF